MQLITIELIWWMITAIIAFAVVYPINNAGVNWVFQTWNIIFVVLLVTFARHIFLLRFSLIGRRQIFKAVLMVLMIALTCSLISNLNSVMNYVEENTWQPLTGQLLPAKQRGMEDYIWTEMLFFGVGCVVSAPLFAGRLFMSIWKQHNSGK